MRVAVDAMGGDYAPVETVKGAVEAACQSKINVVLVGDRGTIEPELAKYPDLGDRIEIKHASEVVAMDEHPATVLRRKPDSSIVIGADMVANGEAQAFISAGNTGAVMAVATLRLGRIKGISRPAIGSLLPTRNGKAVILDAGANADCDVENLLQFAVMGNEYALHVLKIPNPRVGLLSIGEEASKGNELTKAANARLAQTHLNFIGNVEGKDIFRGAADVVICDGFAGNIVLKVAEGMAEFLQAVLKDEMSGRPSWRLWGSLLRPAFRKAKAKIDYAEYGGAPLLGVNGVCIISHGRSEGRAIRNAIRAAANAVDNNVVQCICASVQQEELAAL